MLYRTKLRQVSMAYIEMVSTILVLILLTQACFISPVIPATSPTASVPYTLTILHTSENHGHWEPVEISQVSQGGIARRATLVKKLRSEYTNVLLVDSGDISQGTLYFSQYRGAEGRDFYNLLGYDAVVLGNHEFDTGIKLLSENFLSSARFSVVLANVDFSGEPILAGKIPTSVIKIIGGEKVGIFGLVTDELTITSNIGSNIKMIDTIQAAKDMVTELTNLGVNKIILLSHLGFPADQQLAAKVDGIDVIVSGHTETLMGDPARIDASLGKPTSSYPAVVNSPGGRRTLIVHSFSWGRLLGQLNLVFNTVGEITSWSGEPIFVDKKIPDDTEVAQKLIELKKPLGDFCRQPIGKTAVDMDGRRGIVRNQESNLGNLVVDAMLWATMLDRTQIASANGGGIRASIQAGNISYGQVLEALPFRNCLVQFDLVGSDVLAALENSVSKIESNPEESSGRFLQVGGLKFSADLRKPVGSRVTEVHVGSQASGFNPLEKHSIYRIVALDFMFNGGDGYTMLQNGKNVHGGDVPLDQVLIDYIKAHSPVNPKEEGRIILIKR